MATRREEVRVTADVSNFVTKFAAAGQAADGFARKLEDADGRMANLVQAGLALAPALVPIGAAAVPAIAGLTTQLGFAALAAGTAVLAFEGIGTAVTALNTYKLAPTAAHFQALELAMEKLGPAGQEFVLSVQKIRPEFDRLRNVAEQGLLPGVADSMNELLTLAPQVESVLFTTSTTLGNLVREGAQNLTGDSWTKFFDYLNVTAGPILSDMGRTLGNVVEGIANMVMAFDPLSRSFSTGLLDMSRSFREWSDNLATSGGFQDFVDYVQKSGPRAMDALESIANALIQLVEAAAPVGAAVLPVISALADGLAAIADSPVGPVLITAAAAVGTLGRALAILKTVGLRGDGESVVTRALGAGKMKTAVSELRNTASASGTLAAAMEAQAAAATKARDAQFAMIPTREKRAAIRDYATASERVAAAEKQRSAAIREGAGQFGKTAALVGGLALATSGLADNMGLSNTMSMALMGTIAGPWGAAIGAGVGLTMDFAAANNDLESAVKAANQAFADPTGLQAQSLALAAAQKSADAYSQSVRDAFDFTKIGSVQGTLRAFMDPFTHSADEGQKKSAEFAKQMMANKQALAELYGALNNGDASMLQAPLADLESFAAKIAPALQAAGMSFDDLKTHPQAAAAAIRAYNDAADSAQGRSKAVGDALAGLASEMDTNVTQASALKAALDSLFGVEMSQSAATDAWHASLQSLNGQLKGAKGNIDGFSKGALDSRAAIRSSVSALEDKVNADAAAGVSGDKLVGSLLRGRNAIIRQAQAAGVSRGAISKYLNTLGLTPKNLSTIIKTPGILSAHQKVQALGKLYGLTKKEVRTLISQPGMGRSTAAIDALAKKYRLTKPEVRTLLLAIDHASGTASHLLGIYAGLRKPVVTQIVTQHIDKFERITRATGGAVYGPGTATSDSIPAYLSNGEYVIKAAAVEKYGTAMFDRLNAMHFSDGGPVSKFASGGSVSDKIAELRAIERVRYYEKQLNADGKDQLTGIKRRIAELELQKAQIALRTARADERNGGSGSGSSHKKPIRERFDLEAGMSVKGVRREFAQLEKALGHTSKRLNGLEREAEKVAKAYNREEKQLNSLRSKANDLRGAAAGSFNNDPFGGGASGLMLQLTADTNDARSMTGALRTLKRKHISSGLAAALAASGDLDTAQQLAQMSTGKINQFDAAYASRAQAQHTLGNTAANVAFGKQIRHLSTVLSHLDRRIEGIERAAERGTRKGISERDKKAVHKRRAHRGGHK